MRRIRPLAVLTVVGIALVGISSGVVSGVNSRQKAYTVRTLAAHWKSPYDLLVLPKGASPAVGTVIDPNAVDEGAGGITLAQWKKIQSLPGVSIAAPLVPLGVVNLGLTLTLQSVPGAPAMYQVTQAYKERGMPQPQKPYVAYGPFTNAQYHFFNVQTSLYGLVVAVDPKAETRLVGLKGAVVSGQYLPPGRTSGYAVVTWPDGTRVPTLSGLPLLLSTESPAFGVQTITVRRVNGVPATFREAFKLLKHPPAPGALGPPLIVTTLPDTVDWSKFSYLYAVPHVNGEPAVLVGPFTAPQMDDSATIYESPNAVKYRTVESPYPKQWPVALEAVPVPCRGDWECRQLAPLGEQFRTESAVSLVQFGFNVIGRYDPAKLDVVRDPLTHMPMVNYRPEQGLLVLSPSGDAVNPPREVLPGTSPVGLFDPMPVAITSIANAAPILSKAPIASIRVVARGVGQFGLSAQAKLQALADEIYKATGLQVEIVQGTSPEQVLVHPGYEKGYTRVGWIQEQWVRLGAAVEILRQTLLSQDLILVPILFGAFLFALTVGIIGVEVRKREFGTLLAVGVSPSTVGVTVVRGGLLQGAVVFILCLVSATVVGGQAAFGTALPTAAASGVIMSAALIPIARSLGRMEPLAALREQPTALTRSVAPISVIGLGISLFLSALRRQLAAFLSLLVPAAVLYLIFLVESAQQGTLYLTALGQFILVRVSPLMEMGALVVVVLAVLASALIGMRNALLRAETWAIGAAIGWPLSVAVRATLVEAGLVGALAGVVGASGGALIGDPLFGVPFAFATWAFAVGCITFSGLFAALPAASAISRLDPVRHLRSAGQ